ncbi:MAG TPA: hypothetical protein VG733_15695 [Chthoniobacteraceae bacterium]|nr:hypothetical protein [Chthoniobacteraceae bacterium]
MFQPKSIALRLALFALLYVALIIPWPGWGVVSGVWFRSIGRTVFAPVSGARKLTFEKVGVEPRPNVTRIEIENLNLMQEDGSGPVRYYDVDALSFAWHPTALVFSLIICTPVPWRRKGWALLWGFVCIHIAIYALLAFNIWIESAEVSLVTFSPTGRHIAEGVRDFLLWQLSTVVPVVIWLLVTFRKEDDLGAMIGWFFPAAKGEKPGKPQSAPARKEGGG